MSGSTLAVAMRQAGILHVHADGRITAAHYDGFIPAFDSLVRDGGRRKMIIELGPRFCWSLDGLLRDIRFDVRFRRHFGPTALIGDAWWQRWGAVFLDPLYPVPLRFFCRQDREKGLTWPYGQPNDP